MTFIASLISLLIERFFDWSHLRHWRWFSIYQNYVSDRFDDKSPYFMLALTITPIVITIAVIGLLLQNTLFGFTYLLFQIFILLYCLGPQNLWADTFACIATMRSDEKRAPKKISHSIKNKDTQRLHRHFLSHIFVEGHRRVFGVIFWFVLLGPVGAVLYRSITLSASSDQNTHLPMASAARSVEAILDWLPVRIFSFIFALGGHFVQVVGCWRKKLSIGLMDNETILKDCGIAAMGIETESQISEDGTLERHAIGLLDRTFIITLIIIAVLALLT